MSVIKESFFEASFETKEEFESAEIAAKSDVSDNAELKVTEIKLEKSVIKTNQEKESNDGDKEQLSVEKI
jgi:hypothetical protein|tara:strand:+ start:922 stop:1131 length:210 start_codon:yes stop_codon:yes gene_type:complete